MTIPHLMNCPHSDDGWCLACVKELGEEHDRAIEAIRDAYRVIHFDDDDLDDGEVTRSLGRALEDYMGAAGFAEWCDEVDPWNVD